MNTGDKLEAGEIRSTGRTSSPQTSDYDQTHYTPSYFHPEYLNLRTTNTDYHPIVAILDTGIDPGATGLRTCPDGIAKIVDIIDCTGADEMNLQRFETIETLDNDENDVIEKVFDREYDAGSNSDARNQLSDLINIQGQGGDMFRGIRSLRSFISNRKYAEFTRNQKKKIDQFYLRLYVIRILNQTFAIVDYDPESEPIVMREYSLHHEYGSISLNSNTGPDSNSPKLNFVFHIEPDTSYDDDTLKVSLVFDTGSHATHVAGIVGGSFEDPQMNGVNPHARFLSLKIGDSRLDGMETTDALLRALEILEKRKIKIANYSYGEPAAFKNGRFVAELERVIDSTGLNFVTSAGNSGPSITTIGAPASSTESVISVGAYTNSAHLQRLYNTFDNGYNQGNYHWSSRGPGINHSMGVDVLATGCALTSHPEWYHSDLRMCNGTSMAAPNCAGFLSLVLSNTFASEDEYPHPYWVKKYLEQTCEDLGLPSYSQGRGLIGQNFIPFEVLRALTSFNRIYDITVKTPIAADNSPTFFCLTDTKEDNGLTCPKCRASSKKGIVKAIDCEDTVTLSDMLETLRESETSPCSATLDSDHSYYVVSVRALGLERSFDCTCKDRIETGTDLKLDWDEPRTPIKIRASYHRDDRIENAHLDFVDDIIVHPGSKPLNVRIRDSNISFSTYIDLYQKIDLPEPSNESFDLLIGYVPINVFSYQEVSRGNNITLDPKILAPHYYDDQEIIKLKSDDTDGDSDRKSSKESSKHSESSDNDDAQDDDHESDHDSIEYVPRTVLRLNNIYRRYIVPKSSHIRLSISSNIDQRAFIKICQIYPNASYRDRSYVRAIDSNSLVRTITRSVVPNALTEVCIYSPWDTLTSENLSIKVTAIDQMTSIPKRIYEPGERVELHVNRIYDRLETSASIKDSLVVSDIGSRYYPQRCQIEKTDSIFDKDQYKMLLTYEINPHPKTRYYVNLCNRVYEGPVTQSATIRGYYRGKPIIRGNYVSVTSESPIDTVEIEMKDTDRSRLLTYANIVLNAVRKLESPIKKDLMIIRGFNLIELPRSDLQKIMDSSTVFDGDYLFGSISDADFFIESRKSVKVESDEESKSTPELDYEFFVRDYNLLIRLIAILLENTDPSSDKFRTIVYTSWMGRHLKELRTALAEMNMERALMSKPELILDYLYAEILGAENRQAAVNLINRAKASNSNRDGSTLKTIMQLLEASVEPMTLNIFDKCLKLIGDLESDIEFFRNRFIDTTLHRDQKVDDNCSYSDIYLIRRTFIDSINLSGSIDHVVIDRVRINREFRRLEYDTGICAIEEQILNVKTVDTSDNDMPIDKTMLKTSSDDDISIQISTTDVLADDE
jgi:subtilisin family serine protease